MKLLDLCLCPSDIRNAITNLTSDNVSLTFRNTLLCPDVAGVMNRNKFFLKFFIPKYMA
jgi:hypothetical protein